MLSEHEADIRRCLSRGAHKVQVDLTEGRLAVKMDPLGDLLSRFIDLNNLALARFSLEDRRRIGVHTCPGSDRDSTHVTDPIVSHIETPEEVRDRVLEASEYIPVAQLGTTDDCGFCPFSDDTSTSRDVASGKIEARVRGTALAAKLIGARQ